MLAPDSRVVLLDQLRPPEGYALDAAVGTTFTLDLTAALVPPLAFASFAVRSTTDPVSTLEAVRSCADRVDVFAQAGMVRVPTRYSALFEFLVPMLHEVLAPVGGLFHPKLWLLRYRCDDDLPDSYRLLCLSRNLTDDHSWDVALRLDATRGGRPQASNRPLSALLRSLPDTLARPMPQARRDRVLQLAEDARHLEWEHPDGVTDLALHVFGVNGVRAAPEFSGYRHLVVSPFLNDAGVKRLTQDSRDATVVSRDLSLDGLSPDTLATLSSTYVVSAIAGLDDGDATDNTPAPLLSGLHAKIVVVERGQQAHVFLGSANATDAALGRNVEILVELTGGKRALGVATMLSPDSPFLGMLEPYETEGGAAVDPGTEAQWTLENAVRVLASRGWIVTVARSGAAYSLLIETADRASVPTDLSAQVEPLAHPGSALHVLDGAVRHGTVDGVPLLEISPYLTLRVRDRNGREQACVVRAELRGDPEGRLDEVLASQIDTPEKFLRFVALLLGLGQAHPLAMLAAGDGAAGNGRRLAPAPQLFEIVVRALAQSPESIDDLDRLVQRLRATETGASVLPETFGDLWDVVIASRAQLTEAEAR